ncbi:protein tyrosine phosphatase [Loktanella sp. IMCC34160]|uniref:phosphatase domain-containing putative toxin n=1 Tax=Loktanella sp. IMCC34160 TaxID=2510646 RepID=UPI00101C2AAC|nr:tyrosine-protein phosphatase [Loktanella sp. IMCC34160]RYG89362.1 protein tyrosine phosphatase [Loktanella sp. IMCC34160]
MLRKLWNRLERWEDSYRAKFTHDITDPEERKKSQFYADWVDHGILRYKWHNFERVAPLLWRSNHPNDDRFRAYAELGITTVLNLRGKTDKAFYHFEVESCAALGLRLIDLPMAARRAPTRERFLELIDLFDTLDTPTLIHCKSGADRTGLAAAVYLLHVMKAPLEEARKQLSFRFLHIKLTKTGTLDYILHCYGERLAKGPIPFREWVETEYDGAAMQAAFDKTTIRERMRF